MCVHTCSACCHYESFYATLVLHFFPDFIAVYDNSTSFIYGVEGSCCMYVCVCVYHMAGCEEVSTSSIMHTLTRAVSCPEIDL